VPVNAQLSKAEVRRILAEGVKILGTPEEFFIWRTMDLGREDQ
jgi:hypothetical protein